MSGLATVVTSAASWQTIVNAYLGIPDSRLWITVPYADQSDALETSVAAIRAVLEWMAQAPTTGRSAEP